MNVSEDRMMSLGSLMDQNTFPSNLLSSQAMPSSSNFEWDQDLIELDWTNVGSGLDIEGPSPEFWSKFETLPDLGDNFETLFTEMSDLGSFLRSSPLPTSDFLRNHDCMWAGTCLSTEHSPSCAPPSPPKKEPKKKTVIVQSSRSLLINNRSSDSLRPDTPQSLSESEDDPVAVPAFSATEVTGQVRRSLQQCPAPEVTTVQFDHDYDTKKLRTDDLGVQTPSDSEEEQEEEVEDEEQEEVEEEEEEAEEEEDDEDEEIDVVSLPMIRTTTVRTIRTAVKTSYSPGVNGQRGGHVLPTNPSKQMRHQIQDEMTAAITTNSLISASKAVSRRLNTSKRKRVGGRRRSSPNKRRCGYMVDTEKRSLHNNMERMRRIDLRNAFEDLRQLVPAIADSQKAAKVTILKDATHYVRELHLKDRNLSAQLSALRREQDRLRTTLSQLRRLFAYKNTQQL